MSGSVLIESPCWAEVIGHPLDVVSRHVTYRNMRYEYELKRHKSGVGWYVAKYGQEAWQTERIRLEGLIRGNLAKVENDRIFVPSGIAQDLAVRLNANFEDRIKPPPAKPMRWVGHPPTLRPYQAEAVDKLLAARHGAVAIATGLGKTMIALTLTHKLGLRTVIASPFAAIARQTYDLAQKFLGNAKVGLYGDGRKDVGKLVTICTMQGLHKVAGGPIKEWLTGAEVLIADESHMVPADTVLAVCQTLLANASYRFFLSGTQMRGDGLQKVLEGAIGPIVMEMTTKEGVDQGFLTKPSFRIVELTCDRDPPWRNDPMEINRVRLLRSPAAGGWISRMANALVDAGHTVLILVEEIEQFSLLLPGLLHTVKFAHGGGAGAKDKIPEGYQKSDPGKLVEQFNAGEFPILVGTSCISTGVDVRIPSAGIIWRGLKSDTDTRQAVGRYLRLHEAKRGVTIFDVSMRDDDLLRRHTDARAKVYHDIYPDVKRMNG